MRKYINLEDMSHKNCSTVLNIIQKKGSVTRKQISEISGLSWGGMTKIVNKLLEKGYISEKKISVGSSGRIPSNLSIEKGKNFVVGIDINKTGLSAMVTDLTGDVLETFYSVVYAKEKDNFVEEIIKFLSNIFHKYETGNIISIGIALQGIIDSEKGISVYFPGIHNWKDVPIKSLLEEKFNIPVFVEHDPDCLLYSYMENSPHKNILLFRIDKSIGMAVSLSGKIIKGAGILEIAHNTIIPNGKECSCGSVGCLQPYISACLKKNDDIVDLEAIKELILPLSLTIKNMSNIFNPEKIVLTGKLIDVTPSFDKLFLPSFRENNIHASIDFQPIAGQALKGASLHAINKSINSLI